MAEGETEKRVVVIMPKEMVEFLEDQAKLTGVGNVSALVRMMVRQRMDRAEALAATNG